MNLRGKPGQVEHAEFLLDGLGSIGEAETLNTTTQNRKSYRKTELNQVPI